MERETSWYKAGGVVHNFVTERPMTLLLCSESFPRMDWEFVRNKSIHTVVSSKYKPSTPKRCRTNRGSPRAVAGPAAVQG